MRGEWAGSGAVLEGEPGAGRKKKTHRAMAAHGASGIGVRLPMRGVAAAGVHAEAPNPDPELRSALELRRAMPNVCIGNKNKKGTC